MSVNPLSVNVPSGGTPVSGSQGGASISAPPVHLDTLSTTTTDPNTFTVPVPSRPKLKGEIAFIDFAKTLSDATQSSNKATQEEVATDAVLSTKRLIAFISIIDDIQNTLKAMIANAKSWPIRFENDKQAVTNAYNALVAVAATNSNAKADYEAADAAYNVVLGEYNDAYYARQDAQNAYNANPNPGTLAQLQIAQANFNQAFNNVINALAVRAAAAAQYAAGQSNFDAAYINLRNAINAANADLTKINNEKKGASNDYPLLPDIVYIVSIGTDSVSVAPLSSLLGTTFDVPPDPNDIFKTTAYQEMASKLNRVSVELTTFIIRYDEAISAVLGKQGAGMKHLLPEAFTKIEDKSKATPSGGGAGVGVVGSTRPGHEVALSTELLKGVVKDSRTPIPESIVGQLQLSLLGALSSSSLKAGLNAAGTLGDKLGELSSSSPSIDAVLGLSFAEGTNKIVASDAFKQVASVLLKNAVGDTASAGEIALLSDKLAAIMNISMLGINLALLGQGLGISNLAGQILSNVEELSPSEKLAALVQDDNTVPPVGAGVKTDEIGQRTVSEEIEANRKVLDAIFVGDPVKDRILEQISKDREITAEIIERAFKDAQLNREIQNSLNLRNHIESALESAKLSRSEALYHANQAINVLSGQPVASQIGVNSDRAIVIKEAIKKLEIEEKLIDRAFENTFQNGPYPSESAFLVSLQDSIGKPIVNAFSPDNQIGNHLDKVLADLGPHSKEIKTRILDSIEVTGKQIGEQVTNIKLSTADKDIKRVEEEFKDLFSHISRPRGLSEHISTSMTDMAKNTTTSLAAAFGAHMSGDILGVSSV